MTQENSKSGLLNFLKANHLAVISTVDVINNKPEAACIAFAEREDLSIIFYTSNKSRKYKNLQTNKNVAFVIGWTDEFGSVQYEGIARELEGDEALEHGKTLVNKNESVRSFLTKDDHRLFLVTPTWIRFDDKSRNPVEKTEITF